MTTSPEPLEDSVQDAVARENARRKRVFLAFLSLLLVPIAIGAYAMAKAPSETASLANDVAPIVTERVGGQISARVTNDIVSRTTPLIRASVAQQVSDNIQPRIASATSDLRRDITDLQTSVRATSLAVGDVAPKLSAIPGLEERLTKLSGSVDETGTMIQSLRSDNDRIRSDVAAGRQLTQSLSSQMERVNNDSAASRQQVAELRQIMAKELDSVRSLVNTSAQTANANKDALSSLSRRLSVLEADVKKLQSRPVNRAETVQ